FLEGFSCPLFRDDLLEILYACGVDNFDVYSTEILDPDSGKVYKNYKAVNIIGAVAAADMEKSEYVLSDGIPLIDVPFDKLVLRKDEIQDLLIFRLAENLTTILVHESIRNVLLDKGYITGEYMDAIQFYEVDKFGFL
ncbi:imm11 family protein, partial [Teredinibacter turnerae]